VRGGTIVATGLLDFSKPHVLRSEAEYNAAIAEIERLLDEDAERGSDGYDRLEFLSVLVEHYEDERYPMGAVTPQEAVTFMLEQKGLDRSDLDDVMGGTLERAGRCTQRRPERRTWHLTKDVLTGSGTISNR
jgi:antitoxin component HigA of HigAB toxin-antitoxin module